MANPYRRTHPMAIVLAVLIVVVGLVAGGRAIATSDACNGVVGSHELVWKFDRFEFQCEPKR